MLSTKLEKFALKNRYMKTTPLARLCFSCVSLYYRVNDGPGIKSGDFILANGDILDILSAPLFFFFFGAGGLEGRRSRIRRLKKKVMPVKILVFSLFLLVWMISNEDDTYYFVGFQVQSVNFFKYLTLVSVTVVATVAQNNGHSDRDKPPLWSRETITMGVTNYYFPI